MTKVMQWLALPEGLRPSNYDLKHLSMQDAERLFKYAEKLGVLDKFADLFWDAITVARQEKPSLQECLNLLEEQKRLIGRQYDKVQGHSLTAQARKHYIAVKYNEIEYQIRWMVDTFKLTRTSKPYLLEIKEI